MKVQLSRPSQRSTRVSHVKSQADLARLNVMKSQPRGRSSQIGSGRRSSRDGSGQSSSWVDKSKDDLSQVALKVESSWLESKVKLTRTRLKVESSWHGTKVKSSWLVSKFKLS